MATRKSEIKDTQDMPHPAEGNIAQIRDILFGEAQRSNEEQFASFEKSLTALAATLGDRLETVAEDIGARISDLSSHIDQELLALENRLNDVEATTRSEATEQGESLRTALKDASRSLKSDIRTLHQQMQDGLDALDDKMTAREDLASYLTDVGERLRGAAKADNPETSSDVKGADTSDGDS